MSDETQVYRAQLPFSPVPTNPNVGVPFGNANFVGRLSLAANFNPQQMRWCIHPIVMSALAISYAAGLTWEEAMTFTLGTCCGMHDPSLRALLIGFKKSYEA